jgi:hypothetical protein
VGVVSCGLGGLVVPDVDQRLLLDRFRLMTEGRYDERLRVSLL